jgi:hypothetical protein
MTIRHTALSSALWVRTALGKYTCACLAVLEQVRAALDRTHEQNRPCRLKFAIEEARQKRATTMSIQHTALSAAL